MRKKRCPSCNQRRPPHEFWRNKAQKDGLQVYCKWCQYDASEAARKERARRRREVAV